MIRRIIRKRRPAPSLAGISLKEELALLRVELMYGLRVNREAYLRRKVDEREELAMRVRGRTPPPCSKACVVRWSARWRPRWSICVAGDGATWDRTQSQPEGAPRTRPQAPSRACGRSRVIPIPQVKESPWLVWTGIPAARGAMPLPASGLVKCPFGRGSDKSWHSSVAYTSWFAHGRRSLQHRRGFPGRMAGRLE